MKSAIVFIPVILAVGLFLSTKMGMIGSDFILPGAGVDVQERIAYHADQWGLEKALVKAFARVESNFNPKAINYEKSSSAYDDSIGLMQITPALAYDYGLIRDWRNPSETEIEWMFEINNNLAVACDYIKHLSKYDFQQQIMSYNVGERGYKEGRRNYDYYNKVRGYYEKYS